MANKWQFNADEILGMQGWKNKDTLLLAADITRTEILSQNMLSVIDYAWEFQNTKIMIVGFSSLLVTYLHFCVLDITLS